MEHTEAELLAEKLHNPELFTVGELTRIATLFHVKSRELLTTLAKDERSATFLEGVR